MTSEKVAKWLRKWFPEIEASERIADALKDLRVSLIEAEQEPVSSTPERRPTMERVEKVAKWHEKFPDNLPIEVQIQLLADLLMMEFGDSIEGSWGAIEWAGHLLLSLLDGEQEPVGEVVENEPDAPAVNWFEGAPPEIGTVLFSGHPPASQEDPDDE